ncbi:DNA-binding LytR/AlgR family response regulator [Chryseobacterium sp. H1D6B]|uniref:LytR/AlgR family response regulator transcription factor n=1 Tax=Chryseobacterium sp. H1D6B TaxID=2940588 RepID=UPI0015CBDD83|nr:LytTR family DNA-binding domain-containing protein [Chryseobacterium sp. H1D6B]MDH6253684.1 DNA-binding LytR/AlgR family response regulator [Chryseobacterium sp. H1D6B]
MENKTFAFIKTDKKLIKLFYNDITVIKGLGNYVEINMSYNKKYIYYKSLKDLIESLPDKFMRVHNSCIINLTNIDYFEDSHVICKDLKITVAKSYRECLMNTLHKMML